MKIQKYIIVLFIFLFPIIFSCTKQDGSAPETVKTETDKTKIVELSELSQTVENLVAESKDLPRGETNTNTANSIDPYWLGLDYKVPAWGGITDVTKLPEYIYAKVFWDTKKDGWPTTEELFEKYELKYDIINAVNLNSAGFELYEKEEYLDAIALFREAIWMDPTYAYAHYNLACSAALLLDYILLEDIDGNLPPDELIENRYSAKEYLPFNLLDEIFNHIALSLFLNNKYLEKSQVDADLAVLHSMERFTSFISFAKGHDYWPYYGFFKREDYGKYSQGENISYMVLLDGRTLQNIFSKHISNYLFLPYSPFGDVKINSWDEEVISYDERIFIFELKWKNILINRFGYKVETLGYGSEYLNRIDGNIISSSFQTPQVKEEMSDLEYIGLWRYQKEFMIPQIKINGDLIFSTGVNIEKKDHTDFVNSLRN